MRPQALYHTSGGIPDHHRRFWLGYASSLWPPPYHAPSIRSTDRCPKLFTAPVGEIPGGRGQRPQRTCPAVLSAVAIAEAEVSKEADRRAPMADRTGPQHFCHEHGVDPGYSVVQNLNELAPREPLWSAPRLRCALPFYHQQS